MDGFINLETHRDCEDGAKLIVTNNLYGMPLYAWYVIEIEAFQPGEIEGTLMTEPFLIHGPLDTRQSADVLFEQLSENHTVVDIPTDVG